MTILDAALKKINLNIPNILIQKYLLQTKKRKYKKVSRTSFTGYSTCLQKMDFHFTNNANC